MKYLLIPFAILALSGCTQQQVDRAESAVVHAKEYLERAEAAEAKAAEAVAIAKELAKQLDSEKAAAIVAKADAALAVVKEGTVAAREAVAVAEKTVDAAKSAQAAGGSTWDLLLAGASVLVPSVGGILLAFRKAAQSAKALKQTVSGIEEAREALGEEAWKKAVSPALSSAQDEAVKALVAKVQSSI